MQSFRQMLGVFVASIEHMLAPNENTHDYAYSRNSVTSDTHHDNHVTVDSPNHVYLNTRSDNAIEPRILSIRDTNSMYTHDIYPSNRPSAPDSNGCNSLICRICAHDMLRWAGEVARAFANESHRAFHAAPSYDAFHAHSSGLNSMLETNNIHSGSSTRQAVDDVDLVWCEDMLGEIALELLMQSDAVTYNTFMSLRVWHETTAVQLIKEWSRTDDATKASMWSQYISDCSTCVPVPCEYVGVLSWSVGCPMPHEVHCCPKLVHMRKCKIPENEPLLNVELGGSYDNIRLLKWGVPSITSACIAAVAVLFLVYMYKRRYCVPMCNDVETHTVPLQKPSIHIPKSTSYIAYSSDVSGYNDPDFVVPLC